MNIIITIVAVVLTWLCARYWYQSCYQPIVNKLVQELHDSQESAAHWREEACANDSTPEILGASVIEPGNDRYNSQIEPDHLYIDEDESTTSIGHRYIDDSDDTAEELPGGREL